jgi:wobble nucleotide-excising tRNase
MLQRVISIKNVGCFKNCVAASDVAFQGYTLIFAANARGKTTLCDVLRSLSKNEPGLIIGRATLGTAERQTTPARDGIAATGSATYTDHDVIEVILITN